MACMLGFLRHHQPYPTGDPRGRIEVGLLTKEKCTSLCIRSVKERSLEEEKRAMLKTGSEPKLCPTPLSCVEALSPLVKAY